MVACKKILLRHLEVAYREMLLWPVERLFGGLWYDIQRCWRRSQCCREMIAGSAWLCDGADGGGDEKGWRIMWREGEGEGGCSRKGDQARSTLLAVQWLASDLSNVVTSLKQVCVTLRTC